VSEKRTCEECTRKIYGADGVENPVGKGLVHRACAERLAPPQREDRQSGTLDLQAFGDDR
jgi:hypothetical protein